uniref:Uncharacterized protein n=1 Tax=Arundo donax TaxID=35708 RepID=A0A0A9HK39_ARUDO
MNQECALQLKNNNIAVYNFRGFSGVPANKSYYVIELCKGIQLCYRETNGNSIDKVGILSIT